MEENIERISKCLRKEISMSTDCNAKNKLFEISRM